METKRFDRRLFFGLILFIIGLVILGSNFNIIPWGVRRVLLNWRMIIIVVGILMLASDSNKGFGVVLILLGGFLYTPFLFHFPFNFHEIFWPLVFIALGVLLITRRGTFGSEKPLDLSNDYIDDVSIFGGGEVQIKTNSFRGGRTTSVFGGSTFNLQQSKLAPGVNVIDVFAMFGGNKFLVPSDWKVKIEVTSILGGFSDKRFMSPREEMDDDKLLVIKGVVLLGGGEIKSV